MIVLRIGQYIHMTSRKRYMMCFVARAYPQRRNPYDVNAASLYRNNADACSLKQNTDSRKRPGVVH